MSDVFNGDVCFSESNSNIEIEYNTSIIRSEEL